VVDAEHLLDGLDPEQREVAGTLDRPLRVLAGAGTGKTRAITHRIAYGVATDAFSAPEILAVTFTTRAAGELRARLAALGAPQVQARTFHSAALRQARYFWPQVYGGELPPLLSSKLGLLAEAAGRHRHRPGAAELRDLAGEVEWAKVSNVSADDYLQRAAAASRAVDGFDAATVAAIYASYEEVKRDRSRIDMEDVLLCAAGVLSDDERVAAAVRRQYRQFVVDEFQDVSPLQSALLDLWLGGRDDVCVVGDPAQTIYSFAGASPDYLLRFPAKYPGSAQVTLVRNYRSTPQVIDTANTVLAEMGSAAVRLRAVRGNGPPVTFHGHSDEVAEARAVAERIHSALTAGADPAGIAVLYRVNAASENFEEAFADLAVPFVVRGSERFFDRQEVRQAVVLLRGAARAEAPADAPADASLVADAAAVLTTMGWSPTAPTGRGSVRDRWESLQALISVAQELATASPAAGMAEFVDELQRRQLAQQAPVAAGVTLATLHAAKGMEWPTVFLVGMHEGTMPFVYATTPAAVEEEARLLYVGVTRACDELHVSWSVARAPGGRPSRGPSRFLSTLEGVPTSGGRGSPSGRRRAKAGRIASCRVCSRPLTYARERKLGRCADCPSSYDETLHAALREWRRQRAADEKVPAYCVFTDATLTALAELVPADTASLVRVPGIGPAKVEKYGDELVGLCRSGG
jgi:ATP-dependent DNA helicase UvrD/PcrA